MFKKIFYNLLIISLLFSCVTPKAMINNHVYALRLRPISLGKYLQIFIQFNKQHITE